MSFVTADRVKETTTTTGTGNVTLAGAVSGFQAFSIFANNDTFFYAIVHQTLAEWEVGIGTYVSATPAVARTTVLESSNADALVNFSAGTKDVFVTRPSELALMLKELAAVTAAPPPGWAVLYAWANNALAQVRTIDTAGLIDILSQRDRQRSRKDFYLGSGSDTGSTGADIQTVGINFAALEGTFSNVAGTATEGQAKNALTGAVLDNDAGPGFIGTQSTRDKNPDVTIKFRVNTTVTRRVWIGWMEADHMATDSTPATHKFALRLSTSAANVNYCIVNSDGTTETITQIAVADAAVHTLRLIADNANARWGYSLDGAAITWVTTNIPAAAALIGLQVQIRTLAAAAASMDIWFVAGSMEK